MPCCLLIVDRSATGMSDTPSAVSNKQLTIAFVAEVTVMIGEGQLPS
jgi:hypothetical protein